MAHVPKRGERALYMLMAAGLVTLYLAIVVQSYVAIDSQARQSTSQH